MFIDQYDIAQLTDRQVARMVIDAMAIADSGQTGHQFYRRLARALIRARKERVSLFALAEFECINGDEAGEIVEMGSDLSDGPV